MARGVLNNSHEHANIQGQSEEWRVCEAISAPRKSLGAIPFWCVGRDHRGILCGQHQRIDLSPAAHLNHALRVILTPALLRRNGGRRGLRVRLLLEGRAQQPVSLQALHQIIRVHHRLRDGSEHVRVRLNLRVQIARDASEVVE